MHSLREILSYFLISSARLLWGHQTLAIFFRGHVIWTWSDDVYPCCDFSWVGSACHGFCCVDDRGFCFFDDSSLGSDSFGGVGLLISTETFDPWTFCLDCRIESA